MLQLLELDEPGAVPVYGLEQRLPLVDVGEEVAKLPDGDRAGAVAVEHVFTSFPRKRGPKNIKFRLATFSLKK